MRHGTSQRREQILSAAEKLFQHYGFAKTTVADIAQAARVGVGTVYLEFNSKAAIASELSLRRYDCMLATMREVASDPGSFADRFQRMFTAKLEWLAQYTEAGPHGQELIRGACRATDQAHAGFREAQENLLGEFLQAGVDAGEFEIAEPEVTARVVLRVLHAITNAPLPTNPLQSNPAEPEDSGPTDSNQVGFKTPFQGSPRHQLRVEIAVASELLLDGLRKRNK